MGIWFFIIECIEILNNTYPMLQFENERMLMNQKEKQNTNPPSCYRKIIGRTTYVVHVHFKESAKETWGDKIKRMLREDAEKL